MKFVAKGIAFRWIAATTVGLSARSAAQSNTFPASGNVGIGTTSPGTALHVANGGVLRVDGPTSTGTAISIGGYGSFVIDAPFITGGRFIVSSSGSVGVGTASPASQLHIVGSNWSGITLTNSGDANTLGDLKNDPIGTYVPGKRFLILSDETSNTDASNGGITFRTNNSSISANATPAMVVRETGNVGIGTTSPQALDVNGAIRISGSGAGLTFPDGTVQATAYTGTCVVAGGDYAEAMDVDGDRGAYERGDVLVIGSNTGTDITKSTQAYSHFVAGIYSTKPGVIGRRQLPSGKMGPNEIPMAMVGVVPTKVSAENGAIHRGNLLVSASIPGYAMKGTSRKRMTGAILGKALSSLDSGKGVIEVLVSLQ